MATPPVRPRRPTRTIPDLPPIATELGLQNASLPALSAGLDSASAPSADSVPNLPQSISTELSKATPSTVLDPTVPQQDSPVQVEFPGDDGPIPSQDPLQLTQIRAHYLKKSLIQIQFSQELDLVTTAIPNNVSTLSYLGPPFKPPPSGSPTLDLPLLRYIFRQFVLTFPFMASAPKDFYSDKLQPFAAAVLSRNLSPTSVLDENPENSERATRLKLLAKIERNLTLFVSAATKLVELEQVVRLTQADLDRLERLTKRRLAKSLKERDAFQVNVVSVRTVADKTRVRSHVREEFIIRTRRAHFQDVYVSRRYGDFRTLANELRKHHPTEIVSNPPSKDKTAVTTMRTNSPLSPSPSVSSHEDLAAFQPFVPSRLAREKNRLTLRAYLHSLLNSSVIANSPVLKSFLLSNPTQLTPSELEDVKRREEADRMRDDGRKKFAKEIASRIESLREAVRSMEGDLLGKDGLTRIFATIKVTPNVADLPDNYKAVMEWARVSLASTIFHQLVASDNSSETFASLKRIHGLMPYFMMKTALRITNPVAMIRSILDLFLAQPFGGRSLLQRMFTSSLTEEVRALEMDIEAVKEKVDDPVICEKIRCFVYAPREIQDLFKQDAASEKLNILTIVLRSGDEPVLNRMQLHRVAKANRAHAAYMKHRQSLYDSDDDDGPQDDDAWLFEDLRLLTALYSKLRDREELISLIFEGLTADLLKDIITIFYSPLAQVYRAASIADSLGDLQNFVSDLIKTVESTEELSQQDPHKTVQVFIDLVQAHEQSFYRFVHNVHSNGQDLFDNLMRWIELFLTAVREGLGDPISLEFLLPHTGQARADILAEVDQVALYHYKLKVGHEAKLRRRFGHVHKGNSADVEDEATQALIDSVAKEISFGDLIQGDAEEVAAQESESSTSSEDSTDSDSSDEGDDDESGSSEQSTSEESKKDEPTSNPQQTTPKTVPPYNRYAHSQSRQSITQSPSTSFTPRPRSQSLRQSRSFTALKDSKLMGALSRKSHDVRRPPVPPLPISARSATIPTPLNKPLPASPAPGRPTSSNMRSSGAGPPPTPAGRKPKKLKEIIKPPELRHIPQLRPVFVEMMRPLLRSRSRTT